VSEPDQKPTITPADNGPYLVKGDLQLIDADGKVLRSEGGFALCRCGNSRNKPFCDGAHKAANFESSVRAG
jgi:CDGSH-type Zn-finger protein